MNYPTSERLYNLLPAIYRLRDASEGESLRALLAVIENELQAIEADIDALYDNWFIETCDEWVVPYIGDLLGVRNLHPISSGNFSLRPYVANTLAYRRRKGTASVLEQLARDVTGWPARAVEFFHLLSVTQHLNHVMLSRGQTLDLRKTNDLALLGGPFDRAAYTGEVRRIAVNRGRYNIPNIGLFLWRLQPYAVTHTTARPVSQPSNGRYTFDPLGYSMPLFNKPQSENDITHMAEEINVPGMLRRRPLYDELEALRQSIVDEETAKSGYFDSNSGSQPVLEIFINSENEPIPPEEILICNLSDLPDGDWLGPPEIKKYIDKDGKEVECQIKVAVDPELGRLASHKNNIPISLEVSYVYGFSGDVGGGPYNRQISVDKWYNPTDPGQPVTWQKGITKDNKILSEAPDPDQLVQTLHEAITAWNGHTAEIPQAFGIISIMDSRTYIEDVTVEIPQGCRLAIVAADWPVVKTGPSEMNQRIIGQFTPESIRPHLQGNIAVTGTEEETNSGELYLDGLLLEGKLAGHLEKLCITHCSLISEKGGIFVETSGMIGQKIYIDKSICGPISLSGSEQELYIADSIIGCCDEIISDSVCAINAPGANTDIQSSTIFGSSTLRSLTASNSIFTGPIQVELNQASCVRFSYVPEPYTLSRYRCQPDFEITHQIETAEKANNKLLNQLQRDSIRTKILDWLVPVFTSTRYGHPACGQLHMTCPKQIQNGAEDGSEMGVFQHLQQPQREVNLRACLDEYLRFGLEAGIFYVDYENNKEE
jgi:hypothetical protein